MAKSRKGIPLALLHEAEEGRGRDDSEDGSRVEIGVFIHLSPGPGGAVVPDQFLALHHADDEIGVALAGDETIDHGHEVLTLGLREGEGLGVLGFRFRLLSAGSEQECREDQRGQSSLAHISPTWVPFTRGRPVAIRASRMACGAGARGFEIGSVQRCEEDPERPVGGPTGPPHFGSTSGRVQRVCRRTPCIRYGASGSAKVDAESRPFAHSRWKTRSATWLAPRSSKTS